MEEVEFLENGGILVNENGVIEDVIQDMAHWRGAEDVTEIDCSSNFICPGLLIFFRRIFSFHEYM